MLPFLNPRKISSIIIAKAKPEGGIETDIKEDEMDPGLLAVADDILAAIAGKDSKRLVEALQAAFEMFDMEPHVEGEQV